MAYPKKMSIGDLLIKQQIITYDQLQFALEEKKRTGLSVEAVLMAQGIVSDEHIAQARATQLRVPYVALNSYTVDLEFVGKLPEDQARRLRAIVLGERNGLLLVGMVDPADLFAFDEIARIAQRNIDVVVVAEGQLLASLGNYYRHTNEMSGLARELSDDLGDSYIDFGSVSLDASSKEAPVVKLLQTLFDDAIQVRASDMHIEPQETKLVIRFRIDGALHLTTEADSKIASALVLRLKLMSGLDISEKRLPQDGRFQIQVQNKAVDVRIATCPTQYGEAVVMRLLRQDGGMVGLDKLGMPDEMLQRFRTILGRSNGMILVTGPTGSGKTTTLYSALAEINRLDMKLITVEDPVEYRLPGINQVQINEKIGLTFASVLRSALRQDPDVILVGEMRDAETAQIGLRAAMTGHLVLSTLHTRDAAGTLFRLVDMGIQRFMVASSVQAVIAQRLIRRNCDYCSDPYTPTPQEEEWLVSQNLNRLQMNGIKQGQGCSHCKGTGYAGRVGVYEMLEMNRDMVAAAGNDDVNHFIKIAGDYMRGKTLSDHALSKMLLGQTSVAEVMRISNQLED